MSSSTQRAVEEMRRLIFSGELAAGTDHLETELAERFGVSRTPVREAALILEAQGLVSVRPRRGIRILSVSPGDMAEIYDVLTELESHAAGRAAAFGYSADDLSELTASIDAMEAALDAGDRAAWALADEQFHGELVRLGRNSRVERIVATMTDQVRRARNQTLHFRPLPRTSNADHRAVRDAIAAGAVYKAASIHRAHREKASEMLVDLLRQYRLHRL